VDKLLSAQQVADHLGMHPKTLYKLLRENKIALNFIRLHGRTIAFRPADVERYLGSHEVMRDGSGVKAKAKRAKVSPRTAQVMSDAEAQEFFATVEKKKSAGFVELESSSNC
jgi:excisionase family DNA binding protein